MAQGHEDGSACSKDDDMLRFNPMRVGWLNPEGTGGGRSDLSYEPGRIRIVC
jgi:hypothetical protein